jgi:hypothetical protein
VGTVSGSDAAMNLLGVARATLRTTFRPRFELSFPRLRFDVGFRILKIVRRFTQIYADLGKTESAEEF